MKGITRAEVAAKVGVHKQTIWRWSKQKLFPAPVQIGPKTWRWLEEDVDNWLTSKKEMRNESIGAAEQQAGGDLHPA